MSKFSFLFCVLLFGFAISSALSASLDNYNEDEEEDQNPMKQVLAVVQMISKVQEFKGRALSAFPDPIRALGELTLFGAFKLGFVLLSGLILLGGLFPTFLTAFGISAPLLVRSMTEGVDELKHLNYELIARSIRSLPEKSFEMLDVKGEECRSRAVCEIGEYWAHIFPSASDYIRAFDSKLKQYISQKYLAAMVRGMGKSDCAQSFRTCPHSPFKKFSYLSTYNIF